MRLIDADDLKKKLQYVYSCDYIDSTSKEGIASDIIDEIDNATTVIIDWEKSDAYLDCVKRIMSLEKENEELRQFLKNQGGRQ